MAVVDPLRNADNRENDRVSPIKIRRFDSDEATESRRSSLERLVFRVFFYLSDLALGFALSCFLFPRVVLMPVMLDPRTGQLIDPQTGQVVGGAARRKGRKAVASPIPSLIRTIPPSLPHRIRAEKGDNAQPK